MIVPATRVAQFTLFVVILCTVGCGKSRGTLSGTVKLGDKSVASGSVVVVAEDGIETTQGTISPDGTYKVENVPFGQVKISVHSPDPGASPLAKITEQAKKKLESKGWKAPEQVDNSKWFAIPENYNGAETSGITVKMDQSNKKFDIVMKASPPTE
jgi:hypothetical protein